MPKSVSGEAPKVCLQEAKRRSDLNFYGNLYNVKERRNYVINSVQELIFSDNVKKRFTSINLVKKCIRQKSSPTAIPAFFADHFRKREFPEEVKAPAPH